MNRTLNVILPAKADNFLHGSKWPFYVFILVATIGVIRSCIHIFAPDGGAGSIAGMDLSVTGASEVIFAFALWGSAQFVYAMLQWVVILRYRSLIPLMWMIQIFETLGRMLVGSIKQVTFSHTPPGVYQNYIYLILAISMLGLAVWSGRKSINAK